jgi:hypothetical protein
MLGKIDKTIPYREYMFRVLQNDTETDGNWEGDISITCHAALYGKIGSRLTGLVLRPLWNLNWAERVLTYKNKFSLGDYFQQTISNNSGIPKCAEILHDFLLEHGSQFAIHNVFSTLEQEDGEGFNMSPGATKFWNRRVAKGKARFDEQLQRYRILWES